MYLIKILINLARFNCLWVLRSVNFPVIFIWILSPFTLFKKTSHPDKHKRFATFLENEGFFFIKIGQMLSVRPDIVGEDLGKKLRELQDNVKNIPFKKIKAIIEKELNKPLDQVFDDFDEQPVGSASIAQVHFAKLKGGEKVAIKVLKPSSEIIFKKQIKLFYLIARIINKKIPRLNLNKIVKQFENWTEREMIFSYEASSMNRMKKNFEGENYVYIPEVYWDYSTDKVLVTSRIENALKPLSENYLKENGMDPKEILKKCIKLFFDQVFVHGFFHADMHHSNMLIDENGKICLIDFGITGFIEDDMKQFLLEVIYGFFKEDYDLIAQAHLKYGIISKEVSLHNFSLATQAVGERFKNKMASEFSIGDMLSSLFKIAEDFKMELQDRLILLQKTIFMAEGISRSVYPDINIWQFCKEDVKRMIKKNRSIIFRSKQKISAHYENLESFIKIPKKLDNIEKAISKRPQSNKFIKVIGSIILILLVIEFFLCL